MLIFLIFFIVITRGYPLYKENLALQEKEPRADNLYSIKSLLTIRQDKEEDNSRIKRNLNFKNIIFQSKFLNNLKKKFIEINSKTHNFLHQIVKSEPVKNLIKTAKKIDETLGNLICD